MITACDSRCSSLLVRAGRAVEVWSTQDGKRLSVLDDAADSEITATCSPGKHSFVVTGTEDGFLHLWNVKTGRRGAKYPAHASQVDLIACHGGTKRVLSVGNHLDEAKVWSMESFGKETTPVLRGQPVSGQLWAARLGADSHLVDLVPEFVQSTGEEWRPIVFLALAATAAALLFWLPSGRSKTRRSGRRK